MAKNGTKKKRSSFRWWLFKTGAKALVVYIVCNFFVQINRKPTEVWSLMGFTKRKSPQSTWQNYGAYFTKAAQNEISDDFLAALAQAESAGNPWASPPWQLRHASDFFSLYTPMSSAVGLFQFTRETFVEASGHSLNGRLWDARLSPEYSTQVTAQYLSQELRSLNQRFHLKNLPLHKKQHLAAVIHLCGKAKAADFARHGLNWSSLGMCGPHQPKVYVDKVMGYKEVFNELKSKGNSIASIR